MEAQLPASGWILGVDEHTACVFDLVADTFSVSGRGGVTVRRDGVDLARFETNTTAPIDSLRDISSGRGGIASVGTAATGTAATGTASPGNASKVDALSENGAAHGSIYALAETAEKDAQVGFETRDMDRCVRAILDLDASLEEWASDTSTTDERDRARALFRSLIVRLGERAVTGARDPRELVGPVVEVVLDARRMARERKDWGQSDLLRDALAAAGIEVRDTPTAMVWVFAADPA